MGVLRYALIGMTLEETQMSRLRPLVLVFVFAGSALAGFFAVRGDADAVCPCDVVRYYSAPPPSAQVGEKRRNAFCDFVCNGNCNTPYYDVIYESPCPPDPT